MSEQGWRGFLAAEGVDDWVVLHGGATAVFRVESLGEAARLVEAIAEITDLEASGAVLTISGPRLTVRLTRDMWQLEPPHVELARAVSAVARAHGAGAHRRCGDLTRRDRNRARDRAHRSFGRRVTRSAAVPS